MTYCIKMLAMPLDASSDNPTTTGTNRSSLVITRQAISHLSFLLCHSHSPPTWSTLIIIRYPVASITIVVVFYFLVSASFHLSIPVITVFSYLSPHSIGRQCLRLTRVRRIAILCRPHRLQAELGAPLGPPRTTKHSSVPEHKASTGTRSDQSTFLLRLQMPAVNATSD